MPAVKIHTALDERSASVDKTKLSGEIRKQVFWQTSIYDQRPKLKIWIHSLVIEGLVDIDII